MTRWKKLLLAAGAVSLLLWARSALFIVDATNTALVARFKRPMATLYQPGLHAKLPWPIDTVYRFDRRLMVFDHTPTEYLTQDKKNILIDTFAVWRIAEEHSFLAKVRSTDNARILLLEIITAAVGEVVGTYPLESFINTDPEKVRFGDINQRIADACRTAAARDYGIDLIDVRINSFNFPLQNTASVIQRMRAERERIATKYRSEGEEEALKIEAETELETRKILAEARREAEQIRGEGEAAAIKIYGAAYEKDPEFYRFLRTLEAYGNILDDQSTIVLSTDSDLWKMIDQGAP